MNTYLFSYNYQGAECVFEIRAESADEARMRIARLQYATLDGELITKIPVKRGMTGLLSPLLTLLISAFSRNSK